MRLAGRADAGRVAACLLERWALPIARGARPAAAFGRRDGARRAGRGAGGRPADPVADEPTAEVDRRDRGAADRASSRRTAGGQR